MKNCTIAVILIPTLLLSSISLALSLSLRFAPETQEHHSIPPEAFSDLGSKKGIGFGNWRLTAADTDLTIFSYPAGSGAGGWDNYLQDMLVTITITLESAAVTGDQVEITFEYLTGTRTIILTWCGLQAEQSTTFTEQIFEVTLASTAPSVGGHYFVSADRRV